jgi:hypothetical protein
VSAVLVVSLEVFAPFVVEFLFGEHLRDKSKNKIKSKVQSMNTKERFSYSQKASSDEGGNLIQRPVSISRTQSLSTGSDRRIVQCVR